MTPREYETFVASHFADAGRETRLTPSTNDYGVDVFATRGSERIAIQVKMYGGTSRPVNREMVMQLHGAKDYFDCTHAVLVTNGRVTSDAVEVAKKLRIEIRYLVGESPASRDTAAFPETTYHGDFDAIWERHVMPLEGRTLTAPDGRTNQVLHVDWSGLERLSSSGARRKIPLEIFRMTVNHLLQHGAITRQQINDQYAKRASSAIVLILSQVPGFEYVSQPVGLRINNP